MCGQLFYRLRVVLLKVSWNRNTKAILLLVLFVLFLVPLRLEADEIQQVKQKLMIFLTNQKVMLQQYQTNLITLKIRFENYSNQIAQYREASEMRLIQLSETLSNSQAISTALSLTLTELSNNYQAYKIERDDELKKVKQGQFIQIVEGVGIGLCVGAGAGVIIYSIVNK